MLIAYEKAIEIVKGGGVEGQVQNYAKCVRSIRLLKNVSTKILVNCKGFCRKTKI